MTNENDHPQDKTELQIWGSILFVVAIISVTEGVPIFKNEGSVIIGSMMGFFSGIMFTLSEGKTILKDGFDALKIPLLFSLGFFFWVCGIKRGI